MDSLAAALVFVALALAAWWLLRGRSGFAVDPSATYVLSVNNGFLRFIDHVDVALVDPKIGTKFRLVPAPGALNGAYGVIGDAYTMVYAAGTKAGLTLGCALTDSGVFTLRWGAPSPVLLEVRDDGAILRGSGTYSVQVDTYGSVYGFNTPSRPLPPVKNFKMDTLDGRNLALDMPIGFLGAAEMTSVLSSAPQRLKTTLFLQLVPA